MAARHLGYAIFTLIRLALAHGESEPSTTMDMTHSSHGGTSMAMGDDFSRFPSYFAHPEHTGLMYAHIGLMIISWLVLMPLAVMLSIARSRFTLPTQLAFIAINALGIIASIFYNHQTPDLYKGNSHHTGGWAITWIAIAWCLMSLLNVYTGRNTSSTNDYDHHYSALAAQPASQEALAAGVHDRLPDPEKFRRQRWSRDSGIASQASSSRSSSIQSEPHRLPRHLMMQNEEDEEEEQQQMTTESQAQGLLTDTNVNRLFSVNGFERAFNFIYVLLERFMIPLGYVAFVTGFVAYSGIGRGNRVFNILAHLIKGSIFFGYGLLTLGRYLGTYPLFGWNWARRPSMAGCGWWTRNMPSAEFVESFVIWLYGVTNVFLEHLAAADGAWTPMDFEHVGISMLFFGGGLLGMLVESDFVRRLLDRTIPTDYSIAIAEDRDTYKHSLNPMPALTICLLGYIMSSHTQHSVTSAEIHRTFGLLFLIFAIARISTYITLYLRPPTSCVPTRPPTELVASFGLVCGGLVFMLSNKDTVVALDEFGLDNLFVFAVTTALSLTFMAWEVVLVAVRCGASPEKGSVVRRETAAGVEVA